MKNMFAKPSLKGFSSTLLLIGVLGLTSCDDGDKEATPAPTAAFDYDATNLEVTFINKSSNATTYSWDFGDGETSTEANPVHTYEGFGKYTVKLTATGEGGSDTSSPDEITLAKSSDVEIDGDFADWENITAAATSVDGDGGSLTVLKADYDAEKIYIYVKGNLHNQTRIYLNSDNDATTGATTPDFDYIWGDMGADFFMETDHVGGAQLFADDPTVATWGWTESIAWAEGKTFMTYENGKSGTGDEQEAEFSFNRANIPGMSSTAIRFGVVVINTTTWADMGGLPARTRADGETTVFGETFLLDLTK